MPAHAHNFGETGDKDTDPVNTYRVIASNTDGPVNRNIDAKMLAAGGGEPHENRPPYYTLAYIIKLP